MSSTAAATKRNIITSVVKLHVISVYYPQLEIVSLATGLLKLRKRPANDFFSSSLSNDELFC